MAAIIALIHGEPGAYGISFPDFQGCVSGGVTLDEALRRGRETLAFHIEGMEEAGEPLPKPREIAQVRADPELAEDLEDAVLTLVDVEFPARAVRVNISIDERLLERIDRAAHAAGETRSGYVAAALKGRLNEGAGGRIPIVTMKKLKRRASSKRVPSKLQTRRAR